MAFTLTANANPGNASWTSSSAVIAAAGVATINLLSDGTVKTITVPAGLDGAPVLLSYKNDPNDYGASGGRTNGSVSGTTLTLNFYSGDNPYADGLLVSYAVLALI